MQAKHIRGLGFVAALVVFAVGVLLLVRSRPGEGAELDALASSPDSASARPESSGESGAARDTEGSRDALRDVGDGTEDSEAVSPSRSEPGVELVPVMGVVRRPVHDAELWWWQPADPENSAMLAQLERWIRAGELDSRLESELERLQAGPDGRVRAPHEFAVGCVVARARGAWGWTMLQRSSPDPTYVTLEPELDLRVRVVDGDGAGLPGVHVALRYRASSDEDWLRPATVLTNAEGLATFPHYRALMREHWDYDSRYVLALDEPLLEAVELEFDPTRPPLDVATLQMPPTGSVVLDVSGAEPSAQFALVWAVPSTLGPDERWLERTPKRGAVAGEVRFRYVGLGLELTPESVAAQGYELHEELTRQGPSRAGEEVHLRLDFESLPSASTHVTGRLVGEALATRGARRVEVQLELPLANGSARSSDRRLLLADDARFDWTIPAETPAAARARFTLLGARDERLGTAERDVPAPRGERRIDLGDVVLESLAPLVSGRVVDRAGRPAVGAKVRCWGKLPGGANVLEDGWARASDLQTFTDSRGEFELHGSARFVALGLQALSDDAACGLQVVAVGASDVVLVLDGDGSIAGRLALGSILSPEYLRVHVRREGPRAVPQGSEPYRSSAIDPDGSFVVRGLAAGSYTLTVEAGFSETPLAEVSGIAVAAGETSVDPRVDPLELGRWKELRLLDSEGRPGLQAFAYSIERKSRRWSKHVMPTGKLVYDLDSGPIWIAATSHVITRFDPASRASSLQLERAPVVQIHIPDELRASLGAAKLVLTFQSELPISVAPLLRSSVELPGALSEPFALRHLAPSSWTLYASVDSKSVEVPHELVGTLSTTSGPTPQVLELRWRPEDLAEALEQANR